jgi:hypothetical protein
MRTVTPSQDLIALSEPTPTLPSRKSPRTLDVGDDDLGLLRRPLHGVAAEEQFGRVSSDLTSVPYSDIESSLRARTD